MQDATSGGNRPAVRPPAPRLAPSFTQSINRAVRTVQHAAPIAHAQRTGGGLSENQGAGGAGTARGDRFKSSPTYHRAILSTFLAQPAQAQRNVVQHALAHSSPEGNTILHHVALQELTNRQVQALGHVQQILPTDPFAGALAHAQAKVQGTTSHLAPMFQGLRNLPIHEQTARISHALQAGGYAKRVASMARPDLNSNYVNATPLGLLMQDVNPADRRVLAQYAHQQDIATGENQKQLMKSKINQYHQLLKSGMSPRDATQAMTVAEAKAAPKGTFDHPDLLDRITSAPGDVLGTVGGALGSTLGFVAHGVQTLQAQSGLGDNAVNVVGHRKGLPPWLQVATAAANPSVNQKTSREIISNALNLPAETLASLSIEAGKLAHLQPGSVANDLAGALRQTLNDPMAHPIDTALLASGGLGLAGRLAQAPARLAGRVDLRRPGIETTLNEPVQQARWSASPVHRAAQKGVARAMFPEGKVKGLGTQDVKARDSWMATRHLAGIRAAIERIRRRDVSQVKAAHDKRAQPNKVARAGAQIFKGGPSKNAPGYGIHALIADRVITHPDTIEAEAHQHIADVLSLRDEIAHNPELVGLSDQHIAKVLEAIRDPRLLKDRGAPFRAVEQYKRDFEPVQAKAVEHGHISAEEAARTPLMAYAVKKMPGVRPAHNEGLLASLRGAYLQATKALHSATSVEDLARAASDRTRIEKQINDLPLGLVRDVKVRGRMVTRPVMNDEILAHMKENGVEPGAYVTHAPMQGNSFYLSTDRRPLPATRTRTMWALMHGLTDPTGDALLRTHLEKVGINASHFGMNELTNAAVKGKPGGGYWSTPQEARAEAPPGFQPIRLGQMFHPRDNLAEVLNNETHPEDLDAYKTRTGLTIDSRLDTTGDKPGVWGLIHQHEIDAWRKLEQQNSPDEGDRLLRAANNQFRNVQLSTSQRHPIGVAQEMGIRMLSENIGMLSWLTGNRAFKDLRQSMLEGKVTKEQYDMALAQLLPGGVNASAMASRTFSSAEHYRGSKLIYPVLKGIETAIRKPDDRARMVPSIWQSWHRFALGTVRHMIEENVNKAVVGKTLLREFGDEHGTFAKYMRVQGQATREAMSKGLIEPATKGRLIAEGHRIIGIWDGLTPLEQKMMMATPFGLWFKNSFVWLGQLPGHHPIKAGVIAAADVATEKQRQGLGLDLFNGPHPLPGYLQGAIPAGNKLFGQNYYSPWGIANSPLETIGSLLFPVIAPLQQAGMHVDEFGRKLKGNGISAEAKYVLQAYAGLFGPFYGKAQQVIKQGPSAFLPYRVHDNPNSGATGGSSAPYRPQPGGAGGMVPYRPNAGAGAGGGPVPYRP